MQQVFLDSNDVNGVFTITGEDAFHLIKVVRIRVGEIIRVSNNNESYICEVSSVNSDFIEATITSSSDSTELNNKIYLFQALPKGDRLEGIIEKCVELGVYEIIPVEMKNCVVKLDEKKKQNRIKRYQIISDTAAKQSKRSIMPRIHDVMTYNDALKYAREVCNVKLLPYECAEGMAKTISAIDGIKFNDSIAVFVGPEGGFDSTEVEMASDFDVISLGKRILRTDSAAICMLSILMMRSEEINL